MHIECLMIAFSTPLPICVFNDEDLHIAEKNLEHGRDICDGLLHELMDDYGFSLLAYADCEFGYVGVKGRNGGLTRTC